MMYGLRGAAAAEFVNFGGIKPNHNDMIIYWEWFPTIFTGRRASWV